MTRDRILQPGTLYNLGSKSGPGQCSLDRHVKIDLQSARNRLETYYRQWCTPLNLTREQEGRLNHLCPLLLTKNFAAHLRHPCIRSRNICPEFLSTVFSDQYTHLEPFNINLSLGREDPPWMSRTIYARCCAGYQSNGKALYSGLVDAVRQ